MYLVLFLTKATAKNYREINNLTPIVLTNSGRWMTITEIKFFVEENYKGILLLLILILIAIWASVFYYSGENVEVEGELVGFSSTSTVGSGYKRWYRVKLDSGEIVEAKAGFESSSYVHKGKRVLLLERKTRVENRSNYIFIKYLNEEKDK